jgi:glycosyltransferase involved in cell wall biosynthesis
MKHGFYFFFYKKIPVEWICVILANMAYFLYCFKFVFKKLKMKNRKVDIPREQAIKTIEKLYPYVDTKAEIINQPLDEKIDLSVIIPIYNYENLIEGTIEAILNQKTKYTYEVILVDDGSKQPAKDILEKYKGRPLIKVIHQENGGIGVARNTGLNNASGRYYMFIDCDDTVHDDIVECLMNEAVKNDYDIVMCAHNLSKEKEGKVYSVNPNVYPKYNLLGYRDGDYIWNFAGLPWCKVYKREIFENIRFLPGYWYEDTIIHFLVFRMCKSFKYVPEAKYEYRWYENNFSHTQSKAPKRSVQRYWILLRCIEETERLGLPKDVIFYKLLLRHLGSFYYNDFATLEPKAVDCLFLLGRELLLKYRPKEKYSLPYALKNIEKGLIEGNIELWKLACSIQ